MVVIRGLSSDDIWNFENGYHWYSSPDRICKLLAHFELYKRIIDLPGDVLEFGVYKAASLIRFATFRHALEALRSRNIVGFDAFGEFPTSDIKKSADQDFIERFECAGGPGLTIEEVYAALEHKGLRANIELVGGDIRDTLPQYLGSHPQTKIALLHLDLDVFEPTYFALENLWERVVPGGLVIIDDYNTVKGATDAVDQFFGNQLRIQKLSISHVPAFIEKV